MAGKRLGEHHTRQAPKYRELLRITEQVLANARQVSHRTGATHIDFRGTEPMPAVQGGQWQLFRLRRSIQEEAEGNNDALRA